MTESKVTHKAQLDKTEREQVEDIVTQMRERVEGNVRFQLTQRELDDRPEQIDELDSETEQLVEAIDLEATDGESWSEALDKYVTSVGYTIVNRLTALRCMEVREFIDEEVTVFKQNGLTPAAETLVQEEFLLKDEAIIEAYHNICDIFAEEIEILFDRSSAYSLIDPDDDTFEELCEMLDSVPNRIWRADDVLGWVYEYYNVKLLDDLRRKGDREGLEPEDVPPANQFYTPHWVVRMLTDNSLGKLYLEHTGELQDVVETQEAFSPDERKNRPLSPDESPDISDFCTYLVPSEEEGEPTDFEHPEELRVIDPACGSGHFLLYAFDVLERIWRAETDLATEEIPRKILQNNLYGVDLDMRACQLAAFNLYLKGRARAEAEGADSFDMSKIGVVCADARVADIEGVEKVFGEVANDDPEVRLALERILDSFEEVHGLGSLLDVRGTLEDLFADDADIAGMQLTLGDDPRESHTLAQVLHNLRVAVEEHQEEDSFLAQDLRSFVRLLDILAQDYDVALMNPPYGAGGRMPDSIQKYAEDKYQYKANFYLNFFECCSNITNPKGRIGMIIPRSFMFRGRYAKFRQDFVGEEGGFDFLAEFGLGVLDNATVRTVGTVVRNEPSAGQTGVFLRLHDLEPGVMEREYLNILAGKKNHVPRYFEVPLQEFAGIPRSPICYSVPSFVRELHNNKLKLDASHAGTGHESVGSALPGIVTSDDERFTRDFWEVDNFDNFQPIAHGGAETWLVPQITKTAEWQDDGRVMKRSSKSVRTPNQEWYGSPGLTWNRVKETTRRFGYYSGGLFSVNSFMFFPQNDSSIWAMLSILNSELYRCLALSQTIERGWTADVVGSLPWIEQLESISGIEEAGKQLYNFTVQTRVYEPISPYYTGPELLPQRGQAFYDHPHVDEMTEVVNTQSYPVEPNWSVNKSCRKIQKRHFKSQAQIEETLQHITGLVYDELSVPEAVQNGIRAEIFLRTSESPDDHKIPDPESVPEVPENVDQMVKDLIHHFFMKAVRGKDDGIVPVYGADDQDIMLDRIVDQFEDVYGEHAEDRLIEIDQVLGARSASSEVYPNLREFIEKDLFDYHVNRMEKTPIIWKLNTSRLIADSTGEGFACFVSYDSLDSGLLDRLSNQYLNPRKSELRERRDAANRRRSNQSVSASEQAEAAEQYERSKSGLNQISVFDDVLQDLGSTDKRDFDDEDRQLVEELSTKVATFRQEVKERLNILTQLHELKSEEWFKDTFSNNFWNAVDEWRSEWLDSLNQLEYACKEYAKPVDRCVEAHLADLFDYFNWRLKGSDHYSSTGILFITYYFEREGEDFLNDDGEPFKNLKLENRKLALLATGLNEPSTVDMEFVNKIARDMGLKEVGDLPPLAEFKALAEEIDDRCQTIDKRISSDWADRALSEITTEGYQPNYKHGVKINIKPLAEAEIVPETVDDDVL